MFPISKLNTLYVTIMKSTFTCFTSIPDEIILKLGHFLRSHLHFKSGLKPSYSKC